MKIGIYSEPSGAGIGGSEHSVVVLAEALGREHEVEIVHHVPSLTNAQLADLFGIDLHPVSLRYVNLEPNPLGSSYTPWKRYHEAHAWQRALSEPYDLFINFATYMPPFCRARIGVLAVLFPLFDASWPWRDDPSDDTSLIWKRLRGYYNDWEWKRRLTTYQVKFANSHFTAAWTEKRWGAKCQVVYPPADTNFRAVEKKNSIVSIGRFSPAKKQLEMIDAFSRMNGKDFRDWTFFCVGGVMDSPKGHDYYDKLSVLGGSCRAKMIPNASRASLREVCEESKVFWHATGWGEDDAVHPELMEHFGIVTVEAMAAGCVPVVINRGGQREIVTHGVNGFLWNNREELIEYTMRLARDEKLRAQMSEAARRRAQDFTRQKFVDGFQELLRPLLP
jgi:glycosyltransferase involved in cell wall biosynthesis